MNLLDLVTKKVNLRKVSQTQGGEWQGPCPDCGGNDRFHVWPYKNEGKGNYWCRACNKTGDNIQFLIDFEGLTFKEACAQLSIAPSTTSTPSTVGATPRGCPFTPTTHHTPAELWQEKAEKFLIWSQENLLKNQTIKDWLAARGIPCEAAKQARLGWNPGQEGKDIFRPRTTWGLPELLKENGKPRMLWLPQGLVIPYTIDGEIQRLRIRRPEGEPRYYVVPGSSMHTMILGYERQAFVVVESELDAIACYAASDITGAVAVGTLAGKPDREAHEALQHAKQILNALDYGDTSTGAAKAAERANKWWSETYPGKCDRWPVPKGKDPGEAHKQGIDLGKWIRGGLLPVLTIGEPKPGEPLTANKPQPTPGAFLTQKQMEEIAKAQGLPAPVLELWSLLRANPGVVIQNKANRLTVLTKRYGKFVGGRINHLIFREPSVTQYILNHPNEEIDGTNLVPQNPQVHQVHEVHPVHPVHTPPTESAP